MALSIVSLINFFEVHNYLAYFILFLGSYFDTLIGPGFFVYGEIFFLAGAILAGSGYLNIWIVILACFLGGIIGDSSSFFIGKKYGKKGIKLIFKKENKYINYKAYKKGEDFFNIYGKKSIFFARLLGPLSWITPFLAGVFKIKYKDFLKYNIPGVMVGIGQFILAGYLFGFSYLLILKKVRIYFFYLILGLIVLVLIYLTNKYKIKALNKPNDKLNKIFK